MAKTIRVGLIGCGGNMRGHVSRLVTIRGVEIVGVMEPIASHIALAKEQYPAMKKAAEFTDHRAMLKATEPDAVVISSPHTAHAQQIYDSLRAGCHVLCEKPMVCTTADARKVVRKAKAIGKHVVVSYQRHQQPLFRWMKSFIASGGLGRLQFLGAQQYQSWYDHFKLHPQAWRLFPEQSGGGQLNDSGSHLVDILLHVTGLQPRKVSALTQSFDFRVDINATVNISFKGGAMGSINILGGARGIGLWVPEDITIIGEEAALYYRVLGQPGNEARLEYRLKGKTQAEECLPGKMPEGSDPDHHFVDVILGRAENEAPPECGLRTIQLTEAAWQSAAQGGAPVEVR